MRIAIPIVNGRLAMHFGHVEHFALLDVNPDNREIVDTHVVAAPPHQPGLLPRWLGEQGATVIIAGGMGGRALGLFAQQGITVVVGAPSEPAEDVARKYLDGTLPPGRNICDH